MLDMIYADILIQFSAGKKDVHGNDNFLIHPLAFNTFDKNVILEGQAP